MKGTWKQCKKQLGDLDYRSEDIEQVILTYYHPDHIGLTGCFENAKIIAVRPKLCLCLKKDKEFFNQYQALLIIYMKNPGSLKDIILPRKWDKIT